MKQRPQDPVGEVAVETLVFTAVEVQGRVADMPRGGGHPGGFSLVQHSAAPAEPLAPMLLQGPLQGGGQPSGLDAPAADAVGNQDRKSTRLNSSHVAISYAVFCLK